MRGKTPKDVSFRTDLTDVQAIRVDILDFAKISVVDKLFQFDHCHMISQDVSHYKNFLLFRPKQLGFPLLRPLETMAFLQKRPFQPEGLPWPAYSVFWQE